MNFVALKMLTGDRAKYLGLIFTIAFSSFLLANQTSIFAGILARTGSQIINVADADIWVMDWRTEYVDEIRPLTENDLYRVRGVPGVQWAVRLGEMTFLVGPSGSGKTTLLSVIAPIERSQAASGITTMKFFAPPNA